MPKKVKILVVDGSPLVAQRVKDLLSDWKDRVLIGEARNSEDALTALQTIDFDFVLLDLPFKDSVNLLKVIKHKFPKTKVVMFTNHIETAYRTICMQLGADYFIDKSSEFKILEDQLLKEFAEEI
jgi:DNA-binding NarL/FixJ family response regulator